MKSILFFLCFIVLALTVIPCCACEQIEQEKIEMKKVARPVNDGNTGGCSKDCSPFYLCGNCTGFVMRTQFSVIEPAMLILSDSKNEYYLLEELPLVFLTIWQPPKLV